MRKAKRCFFVGVCLILVSIINISSNAVAAEPKGKAVVVARSSSFVMRGGDCHTHRGSSGTSVVCLLHDGLASKGDDSKMYPAIAKRWEIDPSWKYMKFFLDERATFSNGAPVTAEDVKFSIERAMRKELRFVWGGEMRRCIDRVEAVNKHTVMVYLKMPYVSFLERNAQTIGIIPKAYAEKVGDKGFAKNPIGAGPFKMVDMKQDRQINVVARTEHYRKIPSVKEVSLKYVPENATRLSILQAGEADIVMIPHAHIDTVRKNPDLRIAWSKYGNMRTLIFSQLAFPDEPSPWHDIRVRKAAAYAINTKVIAENVYKGAAIADGNIVAPYHPGYDPSIKPHPYDPEKAKKLLTEAGYPNGFDTVMQTSALYKMDAQAVQASFAKVGIHAKFDLPEHGMWRKMLSAKKLKPVGVHPTPWWSGRVHPATALASTFDPKSAYTYTSDKELTAGWVALSKMIDKNEMAAQIKKMTKLYHEKLLRLNLWAQHTPYGLSKRVKHWVQPPGRVYPVNMEYLTLND